MKGADHMLSANAIRKKYGDYICRRCINKKYHVQLEPKDCVYGYLYKCRCCGQERNIVVGFTPSGHARMLLK